jgi:hypothetical protein
MPLPRLDGRRRDIQSPAPAPTEREDPNERPRPTTDRRGPGVRNLVTSFAPLPWEMPTDRGVSPTPPLAELVKYFT